MENNTTTATTSTSSHRARPAFVSQEAFPYLSQEMTSELLKYALRESNFNLFAYLTLDAEQEESLWNMLENLRERVDYYFCKKFTALLYQRLQIFIKRYLQGSEKEILLNKSTDIIRSANDSPNAQIKVKKIAFYKNVTKKGNNGVEQATKSPGEKLSQILKKREQFTFLEYQAECETFVTKQILEEYDAFYEKEDLLRHYLSVEGISFMAMRETFACYLPDIARQIFYEIGKRTINCNVSANSSKRTLSKTQPILKDLANKMSETSKMLQTYKLRVEQITNEVNKNYNEIFRVAGDSVEDFLAQNTEKVKQYIAACNAENVSYSKMLILQPYKFYPYELRMLDFYHPEDQTKQLTLTEWIIYYHYRRYVEQSKNQTVKKQRRKWSAVYGYLDEWNLLELFTDQQISFICNHQCNIATTMFNKELLAYKAHYIRQDMTQYHYDQYDIEPLIRLYTYNNKTFECTSVVAVNESIIGKTTEKGLEDLEQVYSSLYDARRAKISVDKADQNNILIPLKVQDNQWGLLYLRCEPTAMSPYAIEYFSLQNTEIPINVRNALFLGLSRHFPIKHTMLAGQSKQHLSGTYIIEVARRLAENQEISTEIADLQARHDAHCKLLYPAGTTAYVPEYQEIVLAQVANEQERHGLQLWRPIEDIGARMRKEHVESIKNNQPLKAVSVNIKLGLEELYRGFEKKHLDLLQCTNVAEAILKTGDADYIWIVLQDFDIKIPAELMNIRLFGLFGWTLLHLAIYQGNSEFVAYLMKQGADFSIKDGNSVTPLTLLMNRLHILQYELDNLDYKLSGVKEAIETYEERKKLSYIISKLFTSNKYPDRFAHLKNIGMTLEDLQNMHAKVSAIQENTQQQYQAYKALYLQLTKDNPKLLLESAQVLNQTNDYSILVHRYVMALINVLKETLPGEISDNDKAVLETFSQKALEQIQMAYLAQEEIDLAAFIQDWLNTARINKNYIKNFPDKIKRAIKKLIKLQKRLFDGQRESQALVCGGQIQAVKKQHIKLLEKLQETEDERDQERAEKERERARADRAEQGQEEERREKERERQEKERERQEKERERARADRAEQEKEEERARAEKALKEGEIEKQKSQVEKQRSEAYIKFVLENNRLTPEDRARIDAQYPLPEEAMPQVLEADEAQPLEREERQAEEPTAAAQAARYGMFGQNAADAQAASEANSDEESAILDGKKEEPEEEIYEKHL